MATKSDQAAQAATRIRHRYTQKDTVNYKKINLLIDEEVKTFNSISDSINKINKDIFALEKSESIEDKEKANKLKEEKAQKEKDYKKYSESIKGGTIAENVLKKFSDSQAATDTEQIGAIAGFNNSDIKNPVEESAAPKQTAEMKSIQMMVEKRFTHNEIKNSFAKKNLNYFSEIAKADQIANTKNLAI
jgi:hypothetical protein